MTVRKLIKSLIDRIIEYGKIDQVLFDRIIECEKIRFEG